MALLFVGEAGVTQLTDRSDDLTNNISDFLLFVCELGFVGFVWSGCCPATRASNLALLFLSLFQVSQISIALAKSLEHLALARRELRC